MVFWGLLLVIVASVFAAGAVYVLRRMQRSQSEDGAIEAIGLVFAVVGVLYAIVLAFVVIAVWDKITAANENTYSEANALVDEYWYAQSLPLDQRLEIQRLCRDYTQHVIRDEWKAMQNHSHDELEGWASLDRLRKAVENSRPIGATTQPGQAPDELAAVVTEGTYSKALAQMDVLSQSRAARISAATEGIPAVVWFVLIVGGLLTIAFGFLFNSASVSMQIILVMGLTAAVVMLLYAVYQLEYPFARQMAEEPAAFKFALDRFAQINS